MTLPAMPKGSWISKELKNVYGAKAWKAGKGVDLNGNGRLEKNEKIATYNNNNIPGYKKNQKNPYKKIVGDWTDWLAFYRANHSAINHRAIHAKAGGSTSSIFLWAAKFKTTNPLHIITSIESPLVKQSQVLTAYKKTWKIIARARKIPVRGTTKLKLAKAKLLAVYTAMAKNGIKITSHYEKHLFTTNMSDGVLDCDSSSFVILAEAHEKGWPVVGVRAPGHFFLRWDDKGTGITFNVDVDSKKRFSTDQRYKKDLRISPQSISAGVYLKNLNLSAFVSSILTNRSAAYQAVHKYKEGLRDSTKAIGLDAKNLGAFFNRGICYSNLGSKNTLNAVKDFTKVVALDPHDRLKGRGVITAWGTQINAHGFYGAYVARGFTYLNLNMYSDALKDFLKTIKFSSKPADARNLLSSLMFNGGIAAFGAKDYVAATHLFKILLKVDPKHFTARALIKQCMQLALRQVLVAAIRKVFGASKSESYARMMLKTQKWSTLKQAGVVSHIQAAFRKLGCRKAARSSRFAQRLLKKTLRNW